MKSSWVFHNPPRSEQPFWQRSRCSSPASGLASASPAGKTLAGKPPQGVFYVRGQPAPWLSEKAADRSGSIRRMGVVSFSPLRASLTRRRVFIIRSLSFHASILWCIFAKGCRDFSCLPTNGFSMNLLKAKLLAGEQEATEYSCKNSSPRHHRQPLPTVILNSSWSLFKGVEFGPPSFHIFLFESLRK